jgi:hypothetical protein
VVKSTSVGAQKVKQGSDQESSSASKEIDKKITELVDWRGKTFAELRKMIKEADPAIVEQIKWRKPTNPDGVTVWHHDGGVCTGEIYKDHIKLTFFKGASLEDPSHLFTQPGSLRQAIDFYEGNKINEKAFKALVRSAVSLNSSQVRV